MDTKPKLTEAERRELCARVDFLAVLAGDGVEVKRNGNHYLAKLRPDERTPSCHVYPPGVGRRGADGWTWKDYGDQAGGDALGYLLDVRGLQFMDAVREFSNRAGFVPECLRDADPNAKPAPATPRPAPVPVKPPGPPALSLDEQTTAAAIFLTALRYVFPDAQADARAYLKGRGCWNEGLESRGCWPVGCPAWVLPDEPEKTAFLLEVLANGPKPDLLLRAGLLKPAGDGKPLRLAWWDRVLLLACRAPDGRPAYFVGRRLDWKAGDRAGKYINQPTGAGAVRLPFGLPALYNAAGKDVLLVEGPLDAMGAWTLGWPAVAMLNRPQAHSYADRDGAAVRMLDPHLPALREARKIHVVPDADPGEKGDEGQALAAKLVGWLRAAGCRATLSTLADLCPDAPPDCKDLADVAAAMKPLPI